MPDVNGRPNKLPLLPSDSVGTTGRMRTEAEARLNSGGGDSVDRRTATLRLPVSTPVDVRFTAHPTPTSIQSQTHRHQTPPCFLGTIRTGAPIHGRVLKIAKITPHENHHGYLDGLGG
jgi:hypothetical protein